MNIHTMLTRRGRPPKSKKNSPIIDGAKFIKRFQPKLIYDQRGLLYQDLPIGCVRTLKGGRLYQEILREKNSQYYGGAEIIKIFFRGRTRRDGMVIFFKFAPKIIRTLQNVSKDAHFEWETYMEQRQLKMSL